MRMQRLPCGGRESQRTFSDIDVSKLDTWDLWQPPDKELMPWGGGLKIASILFVREYWRVSHCRLNPGEQRLFSDSNTSLPTKQV